MKILVIAAGPFPLGRGTPARTLRVSQSLQDRGHKVCVAAFPLSDSGIRTNLRVERSAGVRGYRKTSPGPSVGKLLFMSPRLAGKVCQLLRSEPFDVIYAHHYEGLLVAASARRRAGTRTPIVFDAHTLLKSELRSYFPDVVSTPVNRLGRLLDRHLLRLADGVISVSDEITSDYAEQAPARIPILTATNGVEAESFLHGQESRGGDLPIRIVFAGNLSGYQGFELLLRAFLQIREVRTDIELWVASPEAGPVLSSLGLDDPEANGIHLRSGEFRELPGILSSVHVAANPRTVCPGIPQKLLNYMAAGLPTVSFAGSSAILEHETTGLIVDNGDVDEFAEALIRLADDPEMRHRLGRAARELVQSAYNWERVALTFERICQMIPVVRAGEQPDGDPVGTPS